MPVTIDGQTRLLVVAPHPDDETIATGELIQHVRAAGGTVDILLLTAGDNNPWPQRWLERRLRVGAHDRRRWGARRRGEVGQALARLGLPDEALHPLELPDMGVTGRLREDLPGQLREWSGWLSRCRPTLVAIPSLADGHPDHSAAHVLARLAVAGAASRPFVLSYLVHGRTEERGQPVALAAGAAMHATTLAAREEHRSQMALWPDGGEAVIRRQRDLAALLGEERGVRYAEEFRRVLEINLFAPFLDDADKARRLPPLTPKAFAASLVGVRLGAMLAGGGEPALGLATLSGVRDAPALARAAAQLGGGVRLLDLKAASESLVADYRARIGIALIAALLSAISAAPGM